MTTWYYKTNDEWYVSNSNHFFRPTLYADIVIKIRDDGSGKIEYVHDTIYLTC